MSLHLKDGVVLPTEAYDAEPFLNVPVGDGIVDIASAVAAADAQPNVDWSIVEFDHVDGSAIAAARASFTNLTTRGLALGRTA